MLVYESCRRLLFLDFLRYRMSAPESDRSLVL